MSPYGCFLCIICVAKNGIYEQPMGLNLMFTSQKGLVKFFYVSQKGFSDVLKKPMGLNEKAKDDKVIKSIVDKYHYYLNQFDY